METKEILKTTKEIIAKETGLGIDEITLNSHFQDDLNIDDFELANILVIIEEFYNIELDSEDTEKIKTVQDLVHIIEDNI